MSMKVRQNMTASSRVQPAPLRRCHHPLRSHAGQPHGRPAPRPTSRLVAHSTAQCSTVRTVGGHAALAGGHAPLSHELPWRAYRNVVGRQRRRRGQRLAGVDVDGLGVGRGLARRRLGSNSALLGDVCRRGAALLGAQELEDVAGIIGHLRTSRAGRAPIGLLAWPRHSSFHAPVAPPASRSTAPARPHLAPVLRGGGARPFLGLLVPRERPHLCSTRSP